MKIEDALLLIRELEPAFAAEGYHLGLTGSVLYKGESEKDLDLIAYAHDARVKVWSREEFEAFLKSHRFNVLPRGSTNFYDFNKEVLVSYRGDQRVDFFHLQ
jgi:hypothetical protein